MILQTLTLMGDGLLMGCVISYFLTTKKQLEFLYKFNSIKEVDTKIRHINVHVSIVIGILMSVIIHVPVKIFMFESDILHGFQSIYELSAIMAMVIATCHIRDDQSDYIKDLKKKYEI